MSELNKHDCFVLLEAFKQYLYAEDTSRNTSSAYLSDLSHFLNWYSQTIAPFDLDGVTPTDVRDYREHLQENVPPLAPSTINRRLVALRHFFSWTKENGYTENQPIERIRNIEITRQALEMFKRSIMPVQRPEYDQNDANFAAFVAFQGALHLDIVAIVRGQKVGADEPKDG